LSFKNGLFTSESVSRGHPDKICDQISDAVLDAFLAQDPDARVACEAFAANDRIVVAGEFHTADPGIFREIEAMVPRLVRGLLRDMGYGSSAYDIDPDTCTIDVMFNLQSAEIRAGVEKTDEAQGAGDQGMMFGYACDESEGLMPLAWKLSNDLTSAATALVGQDGSPLRPDGKAQVTVAYEDGRPAGVAGIVLSWQHDADWSLEDVRAWLQETVIDPVIPVEARREDCRIWINPSGPFTTGGPKGDTGLTGRKIVVDTYGGAAPHGGGAFSGKDPSKVDRSGAYAARWIAKHVVAAGLARRATIQISYAIGVAEPVSVSVDLDGTGVVPENVVADAITQVFDLRPAAIARSLELRRPIYSATAASGHFGGRLDPAVHRWEGLPHVREMQDRCGHLTDH
jgi:S-adenosylmethionine synthetase